MAKTKRNVGREILDGLREIKRGEYGRVISVPDVAMIRGKTGLSQSRFAVAARRVCAYVAGLGTGTACTVGRRPHVAARCRQEP